MSETYAAPALASHKREVAQRMQPGELMRDARAHLAPVH
jgi:hypothetical protein